MTYNVLRGTLNPTQSLIALWASTLSRKLITCTFPICRQTIQISTFQTVRYWANTFPQSLCRPLIMGVSNTIQGGYVSDYMQMTSHCVCLPCYWCLRASCRRFSILSTNLCNCTTLVENISLWQHHSSLCFVNNNLFWLLFLSFIHNTSCTSCTGIMINKQKYTMIIISDQIKQDIGVWGEPATHTGRRHKCW